MVGMPTNVINDLIAIANLHYFPGLRAAGPRYAMAAVELAPVSGAHYEVRF